MLKEEGRYQRSVVLWCVQKPRQGPNPTRRETNVGLKHAAEVYSGNDKGVDKIRVAIALLGVREREQSRQSIAQRGANRIVPTRTREPNPPQYDGVEGI